MVSKINTKWIQFRISYIGSYFIGWQRQNVAVDNPIGSKKKPSVQNKFENALRDLFRDPSIVASSISRTDKDVNAFDQVVFVKMPENFNKRLITENWSQSVTSYLNKSLPKVNKIMHILVKLFSILST